MISLVIFLYAIGVFGAAISGLSLFVRYKSSELNKFPLLFLLFFVPGINYVLMWEGFKSYYGYATMNEVSGERFRKRMGRATHRKGVDNG